jgi:hypothetical protein
LFEETALLSMAEPQMVGAWYCSWRLMSVGSTLEVPDRREIERLTEQILAFERSIESLCQTTYPETAAFT